MKRMVLYMLLGISLAVLAQQQFERAQEPAGPAGQAEDGAPADEGDAAAPEADPEAQGALEDDPGPVAETKEAAEDEAASEVNMDFEPDEEISEDYPVPLPSDI